MTQTIKARESLDEIFGLIKDRLRNENICEIAGISGVCCQTLYSWVNGQVETPSVATIIPVGLALGDCVEYSLNHDGKVRWVTMGLEDDII